MATLFKGKIEDVVDMLIKNRENDFFNCVAITGLQRRGKSRLAHIISKKTYKAFDYNKHYMGNPDYGDAFLTISKSEDKSTLWVDEAEKIISAEKRMEKEQWWIQQLFTQFGSQNKTILLCTPSFRRIDSRWRDTHISIWIYIYRRGRGIVLRNRNIQSSTDTWALKALEEKEKKLGVNPPDEAVLRVYSSNPCSIFYFDFEDWEDEEVKEQYEGFKKISQEKLTKQFLAFKKQFSQDKISRYKRKAQNGLARIALFLNLKYNIAFEETGIMSGYTKQAILEMCKSFENDLLNERIKEELLPKRYFSEEMIKHIKEKASERIAM